MIQYDTIWYNTGYQSIMGTHNMMLTIMRPYVVRHENFGPNLHACSRFRPLGSFSRPNHIAFRFQNRLQQYIFAYIHNELYLFIITYSDTYMLYMYYKLYTNHINVNYICTQIANIIIMSTQYVLYYIEMLAPITQASSLPGKEVIICVNIYLAIRQVGII